MFLVFIQVAFLHIRDAVLFLQFAAIVVNIRDFIVVEVHQAFALVDFVASEYYNFDFFVFFLWKTQRFYCRKIFAFFFV